MFEMRMSEGSYRRSVTPASLRHPRAWRKICCVHSVFAACLSSTTRMPASLGMGARPRQSLGMTTPSFAAASQELARVLASTADDLARISDATAREPITPGKWSRKEVVGHLIDSASNNHQRFVRGAQDRGGQYPGYDQDF